MAYKKKLDIDFDSEYKEAITEVIKSRLWEEGMSDQEFLDLQNEILDMCHTSYDELLSAIKEGCGEGRAIENQCRIIGEMLDELLTD